MPLKIPVTASFPPSISRGTAVCSGPAIEGIGRGCGSGGFVLSEALAAGALAAGALWGSEGAVCASDESATSTTTKRARTRIRKEDLLFENSICLSTYCATTGANTQTRQDVFSLGQPFFPRTAAPETPCHPTEPTRVMHGKYGLDVEVSN